MNGEEVLNLSHLRRLLAECQQPYIRLDLEDDRIIVLDRWGGRWPGVRAGGVGEVLAGGGGRNRWVARQEGVGCLEGDKAVWGDR